MEIDPNYYYKADEAAKLVRCHLVTLRRYIKKGKLKASRPCGTFRIKGIDIKHFLEGSITSI